MSGEDDGVVVPLHAPDTAPRRRPRPHPSGGGQVVEFTAHAATVPEVAPAAAPGWERRLADGLAFVRRRLEGSYEVDEFGFDKEFAETLALPALRALYEKWFRVEVNGIENVPDTGAALLVANHAGGLWPLDAAMTSVAVRLEHPDARYSAPARRRPALRDAGRRRPSPAGPEPRWPAPPTPTGCCGPANSSASGLRASRASARPTATATSCSGSDAADSSAARSLRARRSSRCRSSAPRRSIRCSATPHSSRDCWACPTSRSRRPFPWLGPLGLVPLPSKWYLEFGEPIDTERPGRRRPRRGVRADRRRSAKRSRRRCTDCSPSAAPSGASVDSRPAGRCADQQGRVQPRGHLDAAGVR